MAEFNVLQNLHLCAQTFVCTENFQNFGEIGTNFSLQVSSQTQFAKINNKKLLLKFNVKNIKIECSDPSIDVQLTVKAATLIFISGRVQLYHLLRKGDQALL